MAEPRVVVVELLRAIKARDTARFRALLFSPFALLFTDYKVGTLWDSLGFLFGPLDTWTEPEIHEQGRITVYKTLCTFQRVRQAFKISLWGNKVMGVGVASAMDIGLLPPWKAPSYVDEASIREEEISVQPYWVWPVTKGTINIPTPNASDRKPAVLLVPGSGPSDRDCTVGGCKYVNPYLQFKDLALGLATAGFVTLRMDKPSTVLGLKMLVTKSCTLQDEYITPLTAALKWLSNHESVDPSKIFILGSSLGGTVAPWLAKASPVPIAGIISCAGASISLAKTLIRQMKYHETYAPHANPEDAEKLYRQFEEIQRVLDAGGLKKGEKDPTKELAIPIPLTYLRDCHTHDPVKAASTLDMPMLFVQGRRDWQVGMEDFVKWQTGLGGSKAIEKAEWKVYDDIGHLLTVVDEEKKGAFQYDEPANVKQDVITDIVDFLRRSSGL